MRHDQHSVIEQLESRTLFSVALTASATATPPVPTTGGSTATSTIKTVGGPTLHEIAGTPFKAALAFYATPVLDPPLGYFATINWGDNTTSNATLFYGSNGNAFGIYIDGTHTYAKTGTYVTTTTLVTAPINPAMKFPTTIIEEIIGKAIVAPFPANSSTGVTIHETVNTTFTADLGTFTTIAPGTGLSAVITWGDGKTSTGTLKAVKPVGVDQIIFEVLGSHKYLLAGKYPIHVTVYRASPSATVVPTIVATIESTAIVASPTAAG